MSERIQPDHHRILWERACSRKRLIIQQRCCLSVRLREQARSHMEQWRSADRVSPYFCFSSW
ncbi:hypothetical protein PDR5_05700 [Pseudomonas sp. DR 5-09]|uniref:Uncharacterized protein n=1 Tax=Pseudomonas fluorescens TaxID=294 RepID=A0A7Z3C159_PSEFL|nr:hypothetical protein PDR5_05700 [Pseudomonas sp. DR 5-09]QJP93563.1 hypothetical protein C6Y56_02820 [Pseudomonas fluorescens]